MSPFEAWLGEVMRDYSIPGAAVAAINGEGETLYQGFFGRRNDAGEAINEDTIFGMASLTKSFTCISIMQLYEKGVIDIYASLSDYLPAVSDKRIKVAHLMNHNAGFYPMARMVIKDVAGDMGISDFQNTELAFDNELAEEGQKRVIERLNSQSIRLSAPGEVMSYCNDGYGLLSEIVRLYGGEASYAEYVKKHILEPLGMDRSGCEFIKPVNDPNCTDLYYKKDGELCSCRDFYDKAFVLHGGGAMRSTVRDMKKYLNVLMNCGASASGERILSPDGVAKMKKGRMVYNECLRYGYGLAEIAMADGDFAYGHSGGLTGISNYMMWCSRENIGVLVFLNLEGQPAITIAKKVFTSLTGREFAELSPCQWDEEALSVAEGQYLSGENVGFTLKRKDNAIEIFSRSGKLLDSEMLESGALRIKDRHHSSTAMLAWSPDGKFLGLRYGGRVLPKIN